MMLWFFVEIALWWWWRCCTTSSWALKSCAIPSRKSSIKRGNVHADERGKNLLFSLSLFHLCNIKKCIQLCAEHSGWERDAVDARVNMRCNFRFQLNHYRNLFGVKLCRLLRISGDRYGLIGRATDSCTWWCRVIEFFFFVCLMI